MRRRQKCLEIINGAVRRVDRRVVGNVVTVVSQWGRVKRQQPDRVDAQLLQVIELVRQPSKISDAVAITIAKRPHVKLVYDRILVPEVVVLQRQRLPLLFNPSSHRWTRVWRTNRALLSDRM